MKKILATILLISFISSTFCSLAYGEEPSSTINNKIEKLSTTYKKLNKKEYKRTTVY